MTGRLALQICGLCALAALGAGAALAVGLGSPIASAHVGKLGTVVVAADGHTVYHLTSEKNHEIWCTGVCAQFWLPVLAKGTAPLKPGHGLDAAKIGTIKRPSGQRQVTYAGFPLYRYYLDKAPGQFHGEGARYGVGVWYAVSAAGKIVKVASAPPPTLPTTTSTGTSTTTSYGGGY